MIDFKIRCYDNTGMVFDNKNHPVSIDTLRQIKIFIDNQIAFLQLASKDNNPQNKYLSHIGFVELANLEPHMLWHLNVFTDCQNKSGVYFIRHFNYPSMIKIGLASCLKNRLRSLTQSNNNIHPQLIGFVETKKYRLVEKYFHMAFNEHRKIEEWFFDVPVENYLNNIRLSIGS